MGEERLVWWSGGREKQVGGRSEGCFGVLGDVGGLKLTRLFNNVLLPEL